MFKKIAIVIAAMLAVNAYAGDNPVQRKPSQKDINEACMIASTISGSIAVGHKAGIPIQQIMEKVNNSPEVLLGFLTAMTTQIYTSDSRITVKQWENIAFTACVKTL